MEEHSGKYRFEADGRKTEATISVKGLGYKKLLPRNNKTSCC